MIDPYVRTCPVGPGQVDELATLFESSRNTRRCWCMAPCLSGVAFGIGWATGSNRRHFASVAAKSEAPMGVLASGSSGAIGWCACGPRSRYRDLSTTRDARPHNTDGLNNDDVWLVPCFFIHADHRRQGVTHLLLHAAVDLAAAHGATAIEGMPAVGTEARPGDLFRGSESLFIELGFIRATTPEAGRATMRLRLS